MRFLYSVLVTSALFVATAAIATAAQLNITPAGDGRFVINGSAMNGVAGMKLDITYDAATEGKPVVAQGPLVPAGAMMAVNTNNPGIIKLAIVSTTPFSGSGQVAVISFATHTGDGSISIKTLEMIDANAAAITSSGPVSSTQSTSQTADSGLPPQEASTTTQERQQQTTQGTPAAATSNVTATAATPSIGSITLPGDNLSQDKPQKSVESSQPQSPQGERAATPTIAAEPAAEKIPSAGTAKTAEIKQLRYAGILERFRNFKGERTLDALSGLFSPVADLARQEPSIGVSTGDAAVKIYARIKGTDKDALPTIATKGAKLLSLNNGSSEGEWVIELTPRIETVDATVSILFDNSVIEIPLVLIPPTVKKLSFSEGEASAFLKDQGAEKPMFDLNRDGKHDYIDDYIYTGHYLLNNKQVKAEPKQPENNSKGTPPAVKKKK